MSDKDIVIGIDLGTTTSEAFIIRDKELVPMKNEEGKTIIHSVVGIDPATKKITIGDIEGVAYAPDDYTTEVKRLMGKKTKINLGEEKYTPEEVSSKILSYIKDYSEKQLGSKIDSAVITVPAAFNSHACEATIHAGKLAGFDNVSIIDEPSAAAIAYTFNNSTDEFQKVMVFDLGGGTFDVSVGEFQSEVLDIKASAGNINLGGKNFDRLIRDYLVEEFKKEHGIDLSLDKTTFDRLLFLAENSKKDLSFKDRVIVRQANITMKDNKPLGLSIKLNQTTFDSLIKKDLEQTVTAMKKALKDAKYKKEDIDIILLVGGSTRIPQIKTIIKEFMGKEPLSNIDPDLAVSQGAAIKATGEIVVLPVIPHPLGTSAIVDIGGTKAPNFFAEIMPSNTPILTDSVDKFITVFDDQEKLNFEVYQKNNLETEQFINEANDNFKLIGKLDIIGIPKNKAGKESITATYNVNADNQISVKVVIDSTEEEFSKIFSMYDSAIIDAHIEENQEEDVIIEIDKTVLYPNYKTTIELVEKKLKKNANDDLASLLVKLKESIINNNKSECNRLDDEINEVLFELE